MLPVYYTVYSSLRLASWLTIKYTCISWNRHQVWYNFMCSANPFHSNLVLIVMRRSSRDDLPDNSLAELSRQGGSGLPGRSSKEPIGCQGESQRVTVALRPNLCNLIPSPKMPSFLWYAAYLEVWFRWRANQNTAVLLHIAWFQSGAWGCLGAKNSRTNQAWNKQLL